MYTIREKAAYSFTGKVVAVILRNVFFKASRVHNVQQALADASFAKLK